MASDFIGGGLPSTAAHTDPNATTMTGDSPAPTSEPPASNPGADDPSAGIAKDAGGVSNTAFIGSPVPNEKKTVTGTVLEAVFGKQERKAEEHEPASTSDNNTAAVASSTGDEQASGTGAAGVLGAVAGGVAAGTAAVASYVGLGGNSTATPEEQGEKTAASVEKSVAETEDAAGKKVAETTEAVTGDDDKDKKVEAHKAATRENVDAIPTAGGEKVGEAHEGESKVIPDVPKAGADESKPGQTDKTTADNTAQNAGAAPAAATAKAEGSESTGKPKFFDRLKAKLHRKKKEKA